MSWRAARRGIVLIVSLGVCLFCFGWMRLRTALAGRRLTQLDRARWMQLSGRMVLAAMGIRYRIEGEIPSGSVLIVSNHLSYLDIVIASAAAPCAFVAKREIAGWPVFGMLARLGGTIFLDRASRASAWDAAGRMGQRLDDGVPVLLFPEGTSTDGSEVIRFHSTLFAPAVERHRRVIPTAIFYEPHSDGVTERDVCWYGDASFLPHLLEVLGLEDFIAVVRFGMPEIYPDRQAAAWRSHDTVTGMRSQGAN